VTVDTGLNFPATGTATIAGARSLADLAERSEFESSNHIDDHIFRDLQTVADHRGGAITAAIELEAHSRKLLLRLRLNNSLPSGQRSVKDRDRFIAQVQTPLRSSG
jgi:hypothetical protein